MSIVNIYTLNPSSFEIVVASIEAVSPPPFAASKHKPPVGKTTRPALTTLIAVLYQAAGALPPGVSSGG